MDTRKYDYRYSPADVRWLAWQLEAMVKELDYPTRAYALHLLWTLVGTYWRGRGIRFGGGMLNRHSIPVAKLALAVCKEITKVNYHSSLKQMGFGTMEGLADIAHAEVQRMIESKEMR